MAAVAPREGAGKGEERESEPGGVGQGGGGLRVRAARTRQSLTLAACRAGAVRPCRGCVAPRKVHAD